VDDREAVLGRDLGGVAGRGGAGVDRRIARAQPDLRGDGRVDVPVGGHVLGAGVVDHQEADLAGGVGQPHPGEAAVGIRTGERVPARETGDRVRGDVAPGVQ
jgi:hypothetical protein